MAEPHRGHEHISRRRLLRGALGSAGAAVVGGCAAREEGSPTPRGTTAATSTFGASGMDWKRFGGSQLNLLLAEHWWTSAIQERLPEFEALTGMTVKANVLSEDSYFQQALVALSSGAATYDGVMVGNLQVGQYLNAGWLEPLTPYLDGDLVNAGWYDLDDLFAPARAAGTRGGELLALPISAEAGVVIYRQDHADAAGVTGFDTQRSLLDAAVKLGADHPRPFVGRGRRGLDIVWTWTNFFLTEGGRFFDGDTPTVDSPAGVAATELYVAELLRVHGPRGASNMSWLEATGAFNEGQASLYTDASGLLTVVLDTTRNTAADQVRAVRWPRGDAGAGIPNYWYWLVGIPRASGRKEQAALFYAWATSKETATAIGRGAGTPSSRRSVWEDEQFLSFYPDGMAEEVVANLDAVQPELVPYARPSFPEEADALSLELVKVLTDGKDPRAAVSDGAAAMARVTR